MNIGDKVEVKEIGGEWKQLIFVKYGFQDCVICVAPKDEDDFNRGMSFNTWSFQKENWRRPLLKSYRPFTWAERNMLRGRIIKPTFCDTSEFTITDFYRGKVVLFKGVECTFEELFRCYCFLGGTPCGVEVKK